MNNNPWIKMNIIKKMLAALVIAGLLVNMEGVQGIGMIKAEAATAYPGSIAPNANITIQADNTYLAFSYYEDEAENVVEAFIGEDVYSQTTIYRGGNGYRMGNVVKTPDAVADTNVESWKYVDEKTVDLGDSTSTLVSYAAVVSKSITYCSNGYIADGNKIDIDSEVGDSNNKIIDEIAATTRSSGSNLLNITLRDSDTFSIDGYRLVGWHSFDDGGGDSLIYKTVGANVSTFPNIEYNAVWEEIPQVTITYRPNGGTGSAVNKTIEFETDASGDFGTVNLLSSADFTREGYTLAGWKVTEPAKTNGNAEYALGAECKFSASAETLVFDAIWERTSVDVSVQYKPNGGTGDAVIQNKTVSVSASNNSAQMSLLDKADFKKSGYTLTGWSDGSKTYSLGANYNFTLADNETSKNLSFDAVWTAKKAGKVEIDVKKPVYVGAKFKYDTDKNSDGDVTLEYKKKGAKDDDYTKKVPTEPGTYTVRATLEETDEYTSAEDTVDFELQYLSAPASPFTYTEVKNSAGTVTDLNVVPASGYSIGVSGKAGDTFGASVLYSAAKKAGGVYLKRDNDDAITEQIQLTEYTVTDKPSITVTPASAGAGKIYYGTQYNVTATSLSPAEKTITYKKAGAGGTYSAVMPTKPDKYTVRVTAPATDFYAAVDEKKDFEIVYLETPDKLAYLDGKDGDKGWFRSEVKIKAPTGYEISTTLTGTYSTSIDWSDKITKLYYRRTSDGATTDGINFNPDAKIDGDAPSVNFEGALKVNSEKKVSVFLDEMTFTIVDDNLYEVTVDGVKQTVSHGRCEIKLAAGTDTETLKVVAKDEAGNTYEFTIELSPQWMETNTMPVGRKVTLKSNIAYSFASGSDYMIDNDDTVYAGGNQFYVKGNMSCTISQKTKAK